MFPSFTAERFGGVQASGREAWQAISGHRGLDATAFFHEPQQPKWKNIRRAMQSRAEVDTLLVWHMGLLKLAPFIAPSRRRLVVFLHGIEAWRKQDPLTSRLLRRTDLFLSNSDFTWKQFAALHPACAGTRHRTVHLGIGDPLRFRPTEPAEPPSALMVGRMCREENYKGHREMIRVWPQVLERVPGAELRIVGDGDLRPELERLTRELGLERQVRFYGQVSDEEKEQLLQECRALALPSGGEGFGLVYLEAMRVGRPSLVSQADAGREVVNPPEAGLAVDTRDSAALACGVARLLLAGREWNEFSEHARQRYESTFTAAHFAERLRAALMGD